ncbi:MFS transporter [Massilia sp. TS11]|uniref:MFS transporter n=1 Tax=Massilia sp. TS11 TaxID=2908003 RepID=UPI001EDB3E88|nr:MFS transporter [Massilia sp. TS11]MCG2583151.1 MFS transporter [Massilia sp. TS11]
MNTIQDTHNQPGPALTMLLAGTAGLGAASLYYAQPMLGTLASSFGASEQRIGLIPTLTQLGYALGILLLIPLGDRHDRRNIIVLKGSLLVLALLAAAAAPSLPAMLAASLAIGLTATVAQDAVPAAASLAHEARRGKVVGTVMTGLLMGILLSRVVSGVVAQQFGWRAMFVLAAGAVAILVVAARFSLPAFAPTTTLPYASLLASLRELWQRHPRLRQAAVAQGLMSLGFSAFWSTLAVMLHGAPFHLGSAVAGAFGLAGAAGALAAPVAGHLADKHGPGRVTQLGAALSALSFAAMAAATTLAPQPQLLVLALATVGFDLGVQATLIAHQTIVYGIDPGARSRLNAVLFVGMFTGMASGAMLGSLLLGAFGWLAVCLLAMSVSLLALIVRRRA